MLGYRFWRQPDKQDWLPGSVPHCSYSLSWRWRTMLVIGLQSVSQNNRWFDTNSYQGYPIILRRHLVPKTSICLFGLVFSVNGELEWCLMWLESEHRFGNKNTIKMLYSVQHFMYASCSCWTSWLWLGLLSINWFALDLWKLISLTLVGLA